MKSEDKATKGHTSKEDKEDPMVTPPCVALDKSHISLGLRIL